MVVCVNSEGVCDAGNRRESKTSAVGNAGRIDDQALIDEVAGNFAQLVDAWLGRRAAAARADAA